MYITYMSNSKNGHSWTKVQIKKLYELYPEAPTWKLLEEFKPRDLMSITSKAHKLKIKRTNKYRFETFSKMNRNKDFIEKNKRIFSTKMWKDNQSMNAKNFWNSKGKKKNLLINRNKK